MLAITSCCHVHLCYACHHEFTVVHVHLCCAGKNKPISGAVPHAVPTHPIGDNVPASTSKLEAGAGIESQGTGH
jgi:hypothetical protein